MGLLPFNAGFCEKIFLLLLVVEKITSNEYGPINVLESVDYDTDGRYRKVTISYSEEEAKQKNNIKYCPKELNNEQKCYIMENITDGRIPEIALKYASDSSESPRKNSAQGLGVLGHVTSSSAIMKQPRSKIQCTHPLQIVREYNFEETEPINSYYSLYGFYARLTEAPLNGSPRAINEKEFIFIQLYKSIEYIDQNARKIVSYRYMISEANVQRFNEKYSQIIESLEENYDNYYDDECNGVQLKKIFNHKRKELVTERFVTETKSLKKYDGNFRIAHLVPTMHILFDGYEGLRGNCTVTAVWEITYKYLFHVDKALTEYVKLIKKNVYISAGHTSMTLDGISLPNLIWKRVIVLDSTNKEVDRKRSFVVMVSNVMNFDTEQSDQLKEVTMPVISSCDKFQFNVDPLHPNRNEEKEKVIKCCILEDQDWLEFERKNWINLPPLK